TLAQQDERVHVQFHAEQANTHAWLNKHCPALRQRLVDCGLAVGHVQALRGLPHDDTLPKGAHGLLQERA
ncbi:MAG: flagellar hook-length control protein FliK, partial [Paraperlucidibaca sp.]